MNLFFCLLLFICVKNVIGDVMDKFSNSYIKNCNYVLEKLRPEDNYDIIVKEIEIGGRKSMLFCITGLIKDEMFDITMQYLNRITQTDIEKAGDTDSFMRHFSTYVSSMTEEKADDFITAILTGAIAILIDGYKKGIVIDCRNYPARNVQEPESDKVLRGSHEGFVESIVINTALIRKKVRSTDLTMERYRIGSESKTDVVLCYMDNKVNPKELSILRKKLKEIKVKSLSMSHESLRECLIPEQVWNPFPKIRYTERPDAAAACIADGNIVILTDGSPTVMISPTGIFDFIQDINDYYFSPVIGTMLRFLRVNVFAVSLLFIPLWYLFVILYKENLPDSLMFMAIEEEYTVPVIVQLFIVEFVIDALRLASLNTPSALSNSFSVVGALVLGEFAVKSGWFVSEVVLFMAFVTISNFVQPSYELGYSIKIFRTFILFLTAILKGTGFIIGLGITILVICFTKTVFGYTYLYPLIPFNKTALKNLIIRRSINFKEKSPPG